MLSHEVGATEFHVLKTSQARLSKMIVVNLEWLQIYFWFLEIGLLHP